MYYCVYIIKQYNAWISIMVIGRSLSLVAVVVIDFSWSNFHVFYEAARDPPASATPFLSGCFIQDVFLKWGPCCLPVEASVTSQLKWLLTRLHRSSHFPHLRAVVRKPSPSPPPAASWTLAPMLLIVTQWACFPEPVQSRPTCHRTDGADLTAKANHRPSALQLFVREKNLTGLRRDCEE